MERRGDSTRTLTEKLCGENRKENRYLREGMNKRARPITPNRTCILSLDSEKSIAPKYIGAVRPQMAIAPKWTLSKKGR